MYGIGAESDHHGTDDGHHEDDVYYYHDDDDDDEERECLMLMMRWMKIMTMMNYDDGFNFCCCDVMQLIAACSRGPKPVRSICSPWTEQASSSGSKPRCMRSADPWGSLGDHLAPQGLHG